MSSYRVVLLDEMGDAAGTLPRVRSISIERDIANRPSLIESASITYDGEVAEPFWARVERVGEGREPLGVFRFHPMSANANRGALTVTADGYSVLKPAEEDGLPIGYTAKAGTDVVRFVSQMLSSCPCEVESEGTAVLPVHIVFTDKDTRLSAAWAVLNAVGWCMVTDGDGNVTVKPLPSMPSRRADTNVMPTVSIGDSVTVEREYDSAAQLFDVVDVYIPRYGVAGTRRATSQSFEIGASVMVTESLEVL